MRLHPVIATLPTHEHQCILDHFISSYMGDSERFMWLFESKEVDYDSFFQSSRMLIDNYLDFFSRALGSHFGKGFFINTDGAFDCELAAIAAMDGLTSLQIDKLIEVMDVTAKNNMGLNSFHVTAWANLILNPCDVQGRVVSAFSELVKSGASDDNRDYFWLFTNAVMTKVRESKAKNVDRVTALLESLSQVAGELVLLEQESNADYISKLNLDLSTLDSYRKSILSLAASCDAIEGGYLDPNVLISSLNRFKEIKSRHSEEFIKSADVLLGMFDLDGQKVIPGRHGALVSGLSKLLLKIGTANLFNDRNPSMMMYYNTWSKYIEGVYSGSLIPSGEKKDIAIEFFSYVGAFSYKNDYYRLGKTFIDGIPPSVETFLAVMNNPSLHPQSKELFSDSGKLDRLSKAELRIIFDAASERLKDIGSKAGVDTPEAEKIQGFVGALVERQFAQFYLYPLLSGQYVDPLEFAPLFADGLRLGAFDEDAVRVISRMGMKSLCEASGERLQEFLDGDGMTNDLIVGLLLQERVAEIETEARIVAKRGRPL